MNLLVSMNRFGELPLEVLLFVDALDVFNVFEDLEQLCVVEAGLLVGAGVALEEGAQDWRVFVDAGEVDQQLTSLFVFITNSSSK
jgi:hypothetical protein